MCQGSPPPFLPSSSVWKPSFQSTDCASAGLSNLADQPVALGIHVRRDVVGHLAGGVAEPDASVEGRGAEPGMVRPSYRSSHRQKRT